MKTKTTENKLPHYFICEICAIEKGGKMRHSVGNTVHMGNCGYCGSKNVTMIPTRDFIWEKK